MKVKIWDKIEPINGKSAEYVLSYRDDFKNEKEVILIYDDYGNVQSTGIPSILKSNLKLDNSMSALEVGEAYLKSIEEQNKQSQDNIRLEEENKNDLIKELANTKLENMQIKIVSEQTIQELTETKLKMIELENKINILGGK